MYIIIGRLEGDHLHIDTGPAHYRRFKQAKYERTMNMLGLASRYVASV